MTTPLKLDDLLSSPPERASARTKPLSVDDLLGSPAAPQPVSNVTPIAKPAAPKVRFDGVSMGASSAAPAPKMPTAPVFGGRNLSPAAGQTIVDEIKGAGHDISAMGQDFAEKASGPFGIPGALALSAVDLGKMLATDVHKNVTTLTKAVVAPAVNAVRPGTIEQPTTQEIVKSELFAAGAMAGNPSGKLVEEAAAPLVSKLGPTAARVVGRMLHGAGAGASFMVGADPDHPLKSAIVGGVTGAALEPVVMGSSEVAKRPVAAVRTAADAIRARNFAETTVSAPSAEAAKVEATPPSVTQEAVSPVEPPSAPSGEVATLEGLLGKIGDAASAYFAIADNLTKGIDYATGKKLSTKRKLAVQAELSTLKDSFESDLGVVAETFGKDAADQLRQQHGSSFVDATAPVDALRDSNGVLRRDLTNVPDDVIQAEIYRITEMNAAEEAAAASVNEAGYRDAYNELPRTERLGAKGQEDLPDADGMVDAERLLEDNKKLAEYNKNTIVRRARAKALERLQAELDSRQKLAEESHPKGEADESDIVEPGADEFVRDDKGNILFSPENRKFKIGQPPTWVQGSTELTTAWKELGKLRERYENLDPRDRESSAGAHYRGLYEKRLAELQAKAEADAVRRGYGGQWVSQIGEAFDEKVDKYRYSERMANKRIEADAEEMSKPIDARDEQGLLTPEGVKTATAATLAEDYQMLERMAENAVRKGKGSGPESAESKAVREKMAVIERQWRVMGNTSKYGLSDRTLSETAKPVEPPLVNDTEGINWKLKEIAERESGKRLPNDPRERQQRIEANKMRVEFLKEQLFRLHGLNEADVRSLLNARGGVGRAEGVPEIGSGDDLFGAAPSETVRRGKDRAAGKGSTKREMEMDREVNAASLALFYEQSGEKTVFAEKSYADRRKALFEKYGQAALDDLDESLARDGLKSQPESELAPFGRQALVEEVEYLEKELNWPFGDRDDLANLLDSDPAEMTHGDIVALAETRQELRNLLDARDREAAGELPSIPEDSSTGQFMKRLDEAEPVETRPAPAANVIERVKQLQSEGSRLLGEVEYPVKSQRVRIAELMKEDPEQMSAGRRGDLDDAVGVLRVEQIRQGSAIDWPRKFKGERPDQMSEAAYADAFVFNGSDLFKPVSIDAAENWAGRDRVVIAVREQMPDGLDKIVVTVGKDAQINVPAVQRELAWANMTGEPIEIRRGGSDYVQQLPSLDGRTKALPEVEVPPKPEPIGDLFSQKPEAPKSTAPQIGGAISAEEMSRRAAAGETVEAVRSITGTEPLRESRDKAQSAMFGEDIMPPIEEARRRSTEAASDQLTLLDPEEGGRFGEKQGVDVLQEATDRVGEERFNELVRDHFEEIGADKMSADEKVAEVESVAQKILDGEYDSERAADSGPSNLPPAEQRTLFDEPVPGATPTTERITTSLWPSWLRKIFNFSKPTPAEVVRVKHLREMIDNLSEDLNHRIERGGARFGQLKARGVYFIRSEVSRLKDASSLDVAAHEAGHHISKVFLGGFDDARLIADHIGRPNVVEDLLRLGEDLYVDPKTASKWLQEGVAELFKYFVIDQGRLEARAPHAFKWLVEDVLTRPEMDYVRQAFERAHDDYTLWKNSPADAKLSALIDFPNDTPPKPRIRDYWLRAFRNQISDNLAEMKRAEALVGGAERDRPSPYMLMEQSRVVEAKFNDMINNGITEFGSLKRVTEPVVKFIKAIPAGRTREWYNYMIAERVNEKASQLIVVHAIDADGKLMYEQKPVYEEAPTGGRKKPRIIGWEDDLTRPVMQRLSDVLTERPDLKLLDDPHTVALLQTAVDKLLQQYVEANFVKREGLTYADIRALVEKGREDKILTGLGDRYRKIVNAMLDYEVAAGNLSPAARTKILNSNNKYFEFARYFREDERPSGGGTGTPWGMNLSAENRLHGSGRSLKNPIEAMWDGLRTAVIKADRHYAISEALHLADIRQGGGAIADRVATPREVTEVFFSKQILDQLEELGVTDASELEGLKVKLYRDQVFSNAKLDRMRYYPIFDGRSGKTIWYQVADKALWDAWKGIGPDRMGPVERVWGMATRIWRAGVTLSPDFAGGTNPTRDAQQSSVFTRGASFMKIKGVPVIPVAPGVLHIRGLFEMARKSEAFEIWNRDVRMTGFSGSSRAAYQRRLAEVTKNPEIAEQPTIIINSRHRAKLAWDVGFNKVLAPFEKLLDVIEGAARVGEIAHVREGKKPIDQYRSRGRRIKERAEAANAGAELTLKFTRGGSTFKVLNRSILPFINPWRLDLVKLYEELPQNLLRGGKEGRKRAATVTLRAMAYITTPALAVHFMQKDDEQYKSRPAWMRYTGLTIVRRDDNGTFKGYFHIPYPQGIGQIFGVMPVIAMEWLEHQDSHAAERVWESFKQNVLPSLYVPGATPVGELFANKRVRDRTPIVPREAESLDPAEQSSEYTGDFSKMVGKELGVSPAKTEHLLSTGAGTIGKNVLSGADYLTRKIAGPQGRPNLSHTARDADPTSEIPVIRRLVRGPGNPMQADIVQRVVNDYQQFTRHRETLDAYNGSGRKEEAKTYAAEHQAQIDLVSPPKIRGAAAGQLKQYYDQIVKLRKEQRELGRSATLSDEEYSRRYRSYNEKIVSLAIKADKYLDSRGVR